MLKRLTSFIALVAACCAAGCGASAGWGHKAVISEKAASDLVGGFSDDDKRLYHLALQHLYNQHQRVGAFTIGQVVDQERSREEQRKAIKEKVAQRQAEAKEDTLYRKAYAELDSSEDAANRLFGFSIYRGYKADELGVHIIVDGDHYEYMSHQDQHRFNQISVNMWALSLRHLYGHEVPFTRRRVLLDNLAGDELYSDVVGQPTSQERS